MQCREISIMAELSDKNNTETSLTPQNNQSEKDISQTKMQLYLRNR